MSQQNCGDVFTFNPVCSEPISICLIQYDCYVFLEKQIKKNTKLSDNTVYKIREQNFQIELTGKRKLKIK